jgi:hypothetical protein
MKPTYLSGIGHREKVKVNTPPIQKYRELNNVLCAYMIQDAKSARPINWDAVSRPTT